MCNCVSVEMGSYDNQRTLPIPTHMKEYKVARKNAGLSPFICIDKCCITAVAHIWKNGIRTLGCCCGHNKVHGFINVYPDDYEKTLQLGYEPYVFKDDNGRKDTVLLSSGGVDE